MLHKIAFLALVPVALLAQSGVTFQYQISGQSTAGALVAGGTITYPAVAVGSASMATVYCSNPPAAAYTLQVYSSNPLFAPAPPVTSLASGAQASFGVTFAPKAAGTASATLTLIFTPASGATQVVQFTLTAQALDGILTSVTVAPGSNQTLITDGGTIAFPATAAGAQAAATFTVTNRTENSVSLDALLLSGTAFQLSGVPLLPVSLPAGGQMSVGILFSPDQAGSLSGTLNYSIAGVFHRILLAGPGLAATLAYEIATSPAQSIQPGTTISFPQTAVGATVVLTVRVRNTGNAVAQISGLDASPSSFQLQSAPAFPVGVAAGGSASFDVMFAPQTPGNVSGVLHIGGASFVLAGTGLGPQFSCTVTAGGIVTPAGNGTTITLPGTSLGNQLQFTVQIANTGNQPGTIANFAIGGNGFSATSVPLLPARVAPGESIQLGALFAPTVLGITGGFLQVNGQTTNFTVAATAPPPLPVVSFTNLPAPILPLTQPLVGIHLAAPYPYDLTGVLSLGFTSDSLVDDPAVQFINGQRYVAFQVPAGASDAVFGTSAAGVILQSGSTAGAITLSATFTMGQYIVTGSSPITQAFSIPAAAPRIQSVQLGAVDSAGFELVLTGVSTTRSMTQLSFTLTPSTGSLLATTTLTADVSAAFTAWYSSALSRSFGGQFMVSIRFNVAGDASAIRTISATATNGSGTSGVSSVTLTASGAPQ